MPSLVDRVTSLSRNPKAQSRLREAFSRFTGGDTKGRRGGRRTSARRRPSGRPRATRKR